MNLLQSLLYRARALPAGELEYLSWFEGSIARVHYNRELVGK